MDYINILGFYIYIVLSRHAETCTTIETCYNCTVPSICVSSTFTPVTIDECKSKLAIAGVQYVDYKPDTNTCRTASTTCTTLDFNTNSSNYRTFRYACDTGCLEYGLVVTIDRYISNRPTATFSTTSFNKSQCIYHALISPGGTLMFHFGYYVAYICEEFSGCGTSCSMSSYSPVETFTKSCVIRTDCGNLTLVNGNVTMSPNTYEGSIAVHRCNTGYGLVGGPTRTCQSNGTWSSAPIFCVRDCGLPGAPINTLVSTSPSTLEGATATYSCANSLYVLIGEVTRFCLSTGLWNGTEPTCVRDCGTPQTPTDGYVTTSPNTIVGTIASYTCNTGFGLVGTSTRTCLASGFWSNSQPLCLIDCGALPSPSNGQVTTSPNTLVNGTASYSCNSGYVLVGNDTLVCLGSGSWNDTVPTCITDCGLPGAPINTLVSTSPNTLEGATATYSCANSLYVLIGEVRRFCLSTGLWNGTEPTCVRDCGTPQTPTDGTVTYLTTSSNTVVGTIVSYTCNSGFGLVGTSTRTCLASGIWSNSQPSCLIDCGVPETLVNGSVSTSPHTYLNATATYRCNTGFGLVGAPSSICLASGSWDSGAPACIVDCGALPSPSNGQVLTSPNTLVNGTASYSCNTGYVLVGNDTLVCLDSGSWNDTVPTCIIVPYNTSAKFEKIYLMPCACFTNYTFAGKTQDEIIDFLVQETQIDTEKTALALSKTNCMEDDRPSAAVVGTVGIVFFAVFFGGLVLLDLITFCQFISTVRDKNKNAV